MKDRIDEILKDLLREDSKYTGEEIRKIVYDIVDSLNVDE